MLQIIESGTWLYDGSTTLPVDIVGLDYDFWYELAKADGRLEEGERPTEPGPHGLRYYVRFRRAGETSEPTWVDDGGHQTVAEAKDFAQANVGSPIRWLT